MASYTRIPKAELTGIYGAMVKRMSRKMFGVVPEPVEVAWHNRKVLNLSFTVGRKAQQWDTCDENLKSFAHMAVASLVGCSFCLDLGYFQAITRDFDLTKAREVSPVARVCLHSRRWSGTSGVRRGDVVTPPHSDRRDGPPGARGARRACAGRAHRFHRLANLYTRTNIAIGIESQGFSAACDLKPLVVASTS